MVADKTVFLILKNGYDFWLFSSILAGKIIFFPFLLMDE